MSLKSLYQHFANHPESTWIMQYPNAVRLYNFIKENNIKKVLDLGTGIGLSASVIALALSEKGDDWQIDSVEQTDKCIGLANSLIPMDLVKKIIIHKSNAVLWQTDHIPYQYFSIYDTLPEGDYDLIVNDGPAPWAEKDNYIEFPNGTIHKMLIEDKIKPGTLVAFDGRLSSVLLLERYFGDNFYLIRPEKGDLTILEKKDVPLKCADEKLRVMTAAGYFKDSTEKITS